MVIHSGSRYLGLEIAHYYQEEACRSLNGSTVNDTRSLIDEYRSAGRDREIKQALRQMKAQVKTEIPKALACCEGQLFEDYLHDMS